MMGNLPPLRPGKIWAIQLYPGGRKAYMQVDPEHVSSFFAALDKLKAGQSVYVSPDQAAKVWEHYQQEQPAPLRAILSLHNQFRATQSLATLRPRPEQE